MMAISNLSLKLFIVRNVTNFYAILVNVNIILIMLLRKKVPLLIVLNAKKKLVNKILNVSNVINPGDSLRFRRPEVMGDSRPPQDK